jgi:hypothetical protein
MENKQTAVEWLVKMLHSPVCVGFIQGRRQIPHDIIQQAKQMEKEQIRDAWTDGCIGELYELNAYFSSGKYYNATYGKE